MAECIVNLDETRRTSRNALRKRGPGRESSKREASRGVEKLNVDHLPAHSFAAPVPVSRPESGLALVLHLELCSHNLWPTKTRRHVHAVCREHLERLPVDRYASVGLELAFFVYCHLPSTIRHSAALSRP